MLKEEHSLGLCSKLVKGRKNSDKLSPSLHIGEGGGLSKFRTSKKGVCRHERSL